MSGQFGALMAPSCLVLSVPFCFLLPSFSTIYSESRPKEADTTEDIDKVRILSSIAVSGLGTCDFEELQSYPVGDPSFQRVDEALASHFALASWYRFASAGKSTVDLAKALKADVDRKIVQLSFTGCQNFSDHDMGLLVQNLPGDLRVLRLDLGFSGLETLNMFTSRVLCLKSLVQLKLRFTGSSCFRTAAGLGLALKEMENLVYLELWCADAEIGEFCVYMKTIKPEASRNMFLNLCQSFCH